MNVVRAQQAEPVQLLHHREPAGHPAHRDVDGERDAELACKPPLGLDHLVLGEARAAGGQSHGEQAVVGGEIGIPDPADVVARDRLRTEEPVLLQRRVGAAVGVLGPDPSSPAGPGWRVRVLGGVVDVGPVDQRRDAGVEALQRPGDVAGVDVLGPVQRGEGVENLDEVVVEGRVWAQLRMAAPRCAGGCRRSRDDDLAGAVHDLGVSIDARLDAGDPVVLDEDVACCRSPTSGSTERTVPPLRRTLPMTDFESGGMARRQYAASLHAVTSLSTVGMTWSSRASANGSGTHSAASRRTGASSSRSPRPRRWRRRSRPSRLDTGSPRRPAAGSSARRMPARSWRRAAPGSAGRRPRPRCRPGPAARQPQGPAEPSKQAQPR